MADTGNDAAGKRMETLRKLFPFQSHFLNVGKGRLHYVDEGSGPVLLLMHACPMWSFSFRRIIQEYSDRFRVIALDQMGFGLSDKPLDCDYRLEAHIDNLEKFVKELDLKDMIFMMHGRGATIGTGFAIRHPRLVRGFIILNSMAFSDYSLPFRLQLCRIPWIGAKIISGLNLFLRDFRKLPQDVASAYMDPFRDEGGRRSLQRFIEDIPCNPEDDSAQTMFEIEAGMWLLRHKKVCIIWARKDWLYRSRYLKKWKQYFPSAHVHELDKAGRTALEDASYEILENVGSFLDSLMNPDEKDAELSPEGDFS